ncbi:hypothetical protein CCS79_08895 [Clostridium diolis]|uniref:hypothetical protein n=1 Tax=Clostridium diolis TaxID=223919 RepID=UPI000B403DD0|nr:hypothetical protein [Clostridium diolis]OVE69033.1 hypothetical protein CCS79_08895 [Clostridium diolis]
MNIDELNERERRAHFEKVNKNFNKKLSRKNNKIECIYTGCSEYAINSHVISKELNLRHIAENGELLHFEPVRDSEKKELVLKNVGINEATTFKGFCKSHDDMFKNIDVNSLITKEDLILQCYRSICYWYYSESAGSDFLLEIHKDVIDTSNARYGKKLVDSALKVNGYSYNPVLNLHLWKQAFWKLINNRIPNEELKSQEIYEICDGISIFFKRLNYVIPVALNTMLTYKVNKNTSNIFHIVVPNETYMDIIVIVNEKEINIRTAWLKRMEDDISILNTIEGWMISNEEWYVKPSILKSITNERMNKISEDMRFKCGEMKLWEFYDASIFDELRIKIIEEMNHNNPKRIFEKEKLNNILVGNRDIRQKYYNHKRCEQTLHIKY